MASAGRVGRPELTVLANEQPPVAVDRPGPSQGDGGALRVFVVSDVRLAREALARLLTETDGLRLVGVADPEGWSPDSVLEAGAQLLIIDLLTMRRSETVERIRASCPAVKIVAFGVRERLAEILECAEAGVSGYVLNTAGPLEMACALGAVERGELTCSARVAAMMFRQVAELVRTRHSAAFPPLTVREREIVTLIAKGLTNKEIARALSIEVATVKTHVHHLFEKLGTHRRSDVAERLRRSDEPSPRQAGELSL